VALSRCTSFEGISLRKPIRREHIFVDSRIVKFLTRLQYKIAEKEMPFEEKMKIIKQAIQNNKKLEIVYRKPNDEKNQRIIKPFEIGEYNFKGTPFIGVRAYCEKRNEERVFRINRVLQINTKNNP
jgi:predicted DNA-binding transcriptional regulator YafY